MTAKPTTQSTPMLHHDRWVANQELHARPFPNIDMDASLLQLCVKATAHSLEAVWQWLRDGIDQLPDDPVAWQSTHTHWVRVEPHTEFVSVLWLTDAPHELDRAWLDQSPEPILVMSRFQAAAQETIHALATASLFADAGMIAGSDFSLDSEGAGHWSYHFTKPQTPSRRGRALQMLVEIETYRTLALVRLDRVRAAHPELQGISTRAGAIGLTPANERVSQSTLDQLEQCESDLDGVWQRINWRVGACRAYYDLVFQRLGDLEEVSIEAKRRSAGFLRDA